MYTIHLFEKLVKRNLQEELALSDVSGNRVPQDRGKRAGSPGGIERAATEGSYCLVERVVFPFFAEKLAEILVASRYKMPVRFAP